MTHGERALLTVADGRDPIGSEPETARGPARTRMRPDPAGRRLLRDEAEPRPSDDEVVIEVPAALAPDPHRVVARDTGVSDPRTAISSVFDFSAEHGFVALRGGGVRTCERAREQHQRERRTGHHG